MPAGPLPADAMELLARPNPAVVVAVRPDGMPVSVPTWYLMDGEQVLLNMDAARRRLDYLRADPRVSLTVMDADDWYTHVSLQGTIVAEREDDGLADIDRLARHYTGKPYRNRERPRVSAWMQVDRWHGWGAMAQG